MKMFGTTFGQQGMHTFLPCATVPKSMFYVGPATTNKIKVSVSTINDRTNCTMRVASPDSLDKKTAGRVANTSRPVVFQGRDGSCSYFSPTDEGGVVVAHSPKSDDSEVLASIVECQ